MRQTLYIDVLFFINFIVDWFILMVTADLLRLKPRWWRPLSGAAAGAFYACLCFIIPPLHFLFSFLLQIISIALITFIVFGFHTFRGFIKSFFVIFSVTVIFGGVMLLLQYHTAAGAVMAVSAGAIYFDMPFLWFVLFSVAAWLLARGLINIFSWFRRKDVIYRVRIEVDGEKTQTNGFYDTGNQLFDPLTNTPVIIAEYAAVRALIPQSARICYREGMECAVFAEAIAQSCFARRFRVVACKGAAGNGDILPGFMADSLEIITNKKACHTGPVVVGVTTQALSRSGRYHLLLHPSLL